MAPDSDPGLSDDGNGLEGFEPQPGLTDLGDIELIYPDLYTVGENERVIVQIDRLHPEEWRDHTSGMIIPIAGYCGQVPGGQPSILDYVMRNWGGGTYKITQKKNGRFGYQATFRVSGPPLVTLNQPGPAPAPPATPAAPAPSNPPTAPVSGTVDIDGIPVGVEDAAFYRQLRQIIVLKSMLPNPAPQDVNAVLLQYILKDKTGPDPLGQLDTLTEMIERVRGIFPAEAGAGESSSTLDKALNMLLQMIAAGQAGNRNLPPRRPALPAPARTTAIAAPETATTPVPARPADGPAAGPSPEDHPKITPITPILGDEAMTKFSPQQLAQAAVAIVCTAYLNGVPENDLVDALDVQLPPMDADTKNMIRSKEKLLYNLALTQVQLDSEETDGFSVYFHQVLYRYTDPERVPAAW